MYTENNLRAENRVYGTTGGVSSHNRKAGFVPAFRDTVTGRIEVARQEDGQVAAMHLLHCLPDDWVLERDASGRITALIASVVAGFVREGVFYTREEAARLVEV